MSTQDKTSQTLEQSEKKPCLFAVHGNTRETRRSRIEAVAELEPSIGFLAAVFDFEWMARRAIVALSNFPSPFIRKEMRRIHGAEGLKNAWDLFVCSGNTKKHKPLDQVLHDGDGKSSADWGAVCAAFKARHPIVHGANGFIDEEDAKKHKNILLNASDVLEAYLNRLKKTAFDRIDRRKWPDGEKRNVTAEKKTTGERSKKDRRSGK